MARCRRAFSVPPCPSPTALAEGLAVVEDDEDEGGRSGREVEGCGFSPSMVVGVVDGGGVEGALDTIMGRKR